MCCIRLEHFLVHTAVVPQPWGVAIDTSTRHIHLGTHHVSLQFKLANYSQTTQQYINLTFLRDDEVINPTQEHYCMTTSWTDPFDSCVATVELQVPWSKPGKYKMRINYTSDVDTEGSGFSPYDTQIIKVKSGTVGVVSIIYLISKINLDMHIVLNNIGVSLYENHTHSISDCMNVRFLFFSL